MWHQDDDKDVTAETDKPPETSVAIEWPKGAKEGEREDLIARFDKIIRGELDDYLLQV